MRDEVERVVTEVIAPLLRMDGGAIEVVRVEGTVVTVRLTGACAGCPGAPFTHGRVIEPALSRALGRAISVVIEA